MVKLELLYIRIKFLLLSIPRKIRKYFNNTIVEFKRRFSKDELYTGKPLSFDLVLKWFNANLSFDQMVFLVKKHDYKYFDFDQHYNMILLNLSEKGYSTEQLAKKFETGKMPLIPQKAGNRKTRRALAKKVRAKSKKGVVKF